MPHHLIDGKAFAETLRAEIAAGVATVKANHSLTPGLAVVLVGDDPASAVYVRNKKKFCLEAGMHSVDHLLPATTTEAELLALIATLNADASIHGILVQLPLPKHIDERRVLEAISPAKDVDGFHPLNVGKLSTGQPALVPCTPLGCLLLLKDYYTRIGGTLAGKHAVILGRSNIVGKPMAQLLLAADCTVTICHSKTEYLVSEIRRGDILVAAIGKPEFVKGHMLKPGAVVIDVGINRVESGVQSSEFSGSSLRRGEADAAIQPSSQASPNAGLLRSARNDDSSLSTATAGARSGRVNGQGPEGAEPPVRASHEPQKTKLVGDVDFAQATAHTPEMPGASAITPVPGGVGPMTIACLLRNTLQAACASAGVTFPL